jgi:DNA-binding protein H-NS
VARELGMGTVVAWFGRLSFDEQSDALNKIQEQHDRAKSTRRAELEAQLAALGYGVAKRRGRPRNAALANGDGHAPVKPRRARAGKVKAKYRDPKTKETWSGRGRMASWLKAKQDAGEKIEKYLV